VLVVEAAFVIPVTEPVVSNFFRDRRRVFAEVACDVLEGSSFDQLLLDVFSIFQREVFWLPGMYLLMIVPSPAVRRKVSSYHGSKKR
jgi:hypothetical protein